MGIEGKRGVALRGMGRGGRSERRSWKGNGDGGSEGRS
jgi:hypothetical protein